MSNNSFICINKQKYRLLDECLGVGSFGEVYKAVNILTGAEVAVKVATCDYSQIAINQVKILSSLNDSMGSEEKWNQNNCYVPVLRLFGTYRSYNLFYIVTQYYGQSLNKLIENSLTPFNLRTALSIFESILIALQPLRISKILHRDIKPSNILIKVNNLSGKYQSKMCDFGLAIKESLTKKTLFGSERVGTIAYESPQVIKFRQYSEKSQVWSLGVILHQLTYCKLPFQKETYSKAEKLYQKSISQPIIFSNVPIQISKFGQKCLASSLHKRFTFQQLKQELQKIISNLDQILQQFKEKQQKIEKNKCNKTSYTDIFSLSGTTLTAYSYSDHSIKDNATNGSKERKISCDTIEADVIGRRGFPEILIQCYKELQQRINNIKKPKKQNQIQLLNLCDNFVNKQKTNEFCLNFFSPQVITILSRNINKLKLICEYAQDQKQVSFNLKQFMLADTLMLIYEATILKMKKNQQNIVLLEEHLKISGQAKSMHYYKQLRIKVINFV